MLLACLTPSEGATLAEKLYCAYNAGGDPATAGLNFRGDPCPAWADLSENVRAKWEAVAAAVLVPGTFGWALEMAKRGHRIQRAGWNGKGMWVALTRGSRIAPELARAGAAEHRANELRSNPPAADYLDVEICPHLDMRAANGSITIGWNASQPDMLADDWCVLA